MKLKVKMVNVYGQLKLDIIVKNIVRLFINVCVVILLFLRYFMIRFLFLGEIGNFKLNKNM